MLTLVTTGCVSGGLHARGEQRVSVLGSFGHPIKGPAIWPSGEGRADDAGVTLDYQYFFRDRVSFLAAGTPYRNYNQSDGDVYAGEFQIGFRWYFWETEVLHAPVGLYAEIFGGLMNGSRSVPEDGSNTNFTQDTGVGLEVQLDDNVSWITGYRLKHLSNGRVFRSDSNPGQNDHQIYTGLMFRLP